MEQSTINDLIMALKAMYSNCWTEDEVMMALIATGNPSEDLTMRAERIGKAFQMAKKALDKVKQS